MLGQVGFDSAAEEMVKLSEIGSKEACRKPLIALERSMDQLPQ
jgi:hypothetical protein